ncbi:MAG TPA: DEAD/DEAH box helicase, partial [Streptosporangiaceae bacterium]|nr:DEAD/DEAH box helicase [Streptosporangiaceae bacterium]
MPHSSRRPRASSDRRGRGRPRRSGPARTAKPRPAGPHAELDLALDTAAAAPQPAAVTFAQLGLDPRLVRALAARDIHEPFAIQARALPDALAGRDVLGRAQTGSGKTLAFGLPLLTRLAGGTGREKAPRGLVLVPTRELAQQVADALAPLGRSIGVSITTVYGGVSISRQITSVRRADVVVATPGRLIDLLERHALTLSGIGVTVLDEADHMADLGFMPAVTRILDQTPADGQRMFFSATLDRGVGELVTSYISDPALHAVTSSADSGPAEHRVLVLSAQDKVPVAAEIASRPGRTLFFVRTKHGADRLAKQLSRAGVEAAAIHGDRNQSQRQRALDAFTAGHPRVLVATDVAARGIHVDDVDLVVQFDPPNDHKDYLHRSGRTARAGASGTVVALVEPGQVRDLRRLHEAAGVTAASHEVAAGHHVVRQIAASGTPVPPAPPAQPARAARPARPARPAPLRPPASPTPAATGRPAGTARRGETGREGDNGHR